MFPGGRMNPRQMKAMMKKMGISSEEIDEVEEIVIRTKTKELVFHNATVTAMSVQGQKTFQITGEPEVRSRTIEQSKEPPGEDIELVIEQTGVSEKEARTALEECNGQPAEAILRIMSSR